MATSSSTTALLTVEIIAQFEIESRFFEGKTIEVKRDSEGEEKLVEWQFEEELGHGAFGDVTLERDVASGNTRAVKMIKKTDEKTLDHRKELLALSSLSKVRKPSSHGRGVNQNFSTMFASLPFMVISKTHIFPATSTLPWSTFHVVICSSI